MQNTIELPLQDTIINEVTWACLSKMQEASPWLWKQGVDTERQNALSKITQPIRGTDPADSGLALKSTGQAWHSELWVHRIDEYLPPESSNNQVLWKEYGLALQVSIMWRPLKNHRSHSRIRMHLSDLFGDKPAGLGYTKCPPHWYLYLNCECLTNSISTRQLCKNASQNTPAAFHSTGFCNVLATLALPETRQGKK